MLLGCVVLSACAHQEPGASAEKIAHAEQLYTQCVEGLGLTLERLDIEPNGDIDVEFAEGYTDEDLALANAICEPLIRSVLEPGGVPVLGPPKNLGRPGSDQDIDALLAARVSLGFQGAVLAEVDGERRVMAGIGPLSASATRVPDAQTAFDCGSIMKEVTAAVIFLLEQDGALSRQQTLGDFFPDAPRVWRDVSVDQVLSHSAGFHDYHDTEGDFEEMDRATALAYIFAQAPLFEPGTEHAYSNSGYTLLAALIELVTGEDYRSIARERVFEPLGMLRTGFYGDPLWNDRNVAVGRGAAVQGDNDPSHWPQPSWALMGNGGLVSTLEDLLSLAKAFDGENLFEPKTAEAFRLAQPTGSIGGKELFGFAGGNDFGFNVVVGKVPEDATYVIAASHVLAPVTAEILAIELIQTLYGEVATLPEGY
jgi:CubicO group peptidase (beta-lactamase class C family)